MLNSWKRPPPTKPTAALRTVAQTFYRSQRTLGRVSSGESRLVLDPHKLSRRQTGVHHLRSTEERRSIKDGGGLGHRFRKRLRGNLERNAKQLGNKHIVATLGKVPTPLAACPVPVVLKSLKLDS